MMQLNSLTQDNLQTSFLLKELILKVSELESKCEYLESEVSRLKAENIQLKRESNFWKAQHKRSLKREEKYKQIIEELRAKVKLREKQLFARKTEKNKSKPESQTQTETINPRGHQKGTPGHSKKNYSNLPSITEVIDLPEDKKYCPECGLPYKEIDITEDSEIIEIVHVKAHRRIIKRKMYTASEQCNCGSKLITAPPTDRLFSKTRYGISVWTKILTEKFGYHLPLNRLLSMLDEYGLNLPAGSITDGLKKMSKFFLPVYDKIQAHCLLSEHWHADETGWKVFEEVPDKIGNRWYLWTFCSKDAALFKLDKSRSSNVPKSFFGNKKGILSVDRYSAYKAIAKNGNLILAFCWAHVRRDFLTHAKTHPKQEKWGMNWVKSIGNLYHINNKRISYDNNSAGFIKYNAKLEQAIKCMQKEYQSQLKDEKLHESAKKLLKSLDNHWNGLIIFVKQPEIPMDNNTAEQTLRGSVIGRNNYYGSGSEWSGELAAIMFSIFKTLKKWNIIPSIWLTEYLSACAKNANSPPVNIEKYMPWSMSEENKKKFQSHNPL